MSAPAVQAVPTKGVTKVGAPAGKNKRAVVAKPKAKSDKAAPTVSVPAATAPTTEEGGAAEKAAAAPDGLSACTLCDFTTTSKQQMIDHLRTHTARKVP